MPLLATDSYTPGISSALEALARFRLVAGLLPDLRFGESNGEALRLVLNAINDCLASCCDEPAAPLARSRNAAGAARLLLRDHLMTEARARLN
jgi:hypothetical protein